MEISKDMKDEERTVYKSIGIAQTLNPDNDTKKKSSIFYPYYQERPIYIYAISLKNVISITKKPLKE